MELTPIMTTSKICGIREIRAAAKAAEEQTSTTAHFIFPTSTTNVPSPTESVERARTKGTCFCSISSLLFLLGGRVSLQNTKNDWWPWKLFRSVGWNCSHERTPMLHCATTTATANVFRPKRGASPPKLLPPLLTHSERKKTHPPLLKHEIWRDRMAEQG